MSFKIQEMLQIEASYKQTHLIKEYQFQEQYNLIMFCSLWVTEEQNCRQLVLEEGLEIP